MLKISDRKWKTQFKAEVPVWRQAKNRFHCQSNDA